MANINYKSTKNTATDTHVATPISALGSTMGYQGIVTWADQIDFGKFRIGCQGAQGNNTNNIPETNYTYASFIDTLQISFSYIKSKLDGYQSQITSMQTQMSGMVTEIQGLRTDYSNLNGQTIHSMLTQISGMQSQIAGLISRIEELENGQSSQPSIVSVTGVSVSPTSKLFSSANSTATLTATVSPSTATNKTITWSSSNTNVATVSSTGALTAKVTAKASGSAVITCTTQDGGHQATCTVTVSIPQTTYYWWVGNSSNNPQNDTNIETYAGEFNGDPNIENSYGRIGWHLIGSEDAINNYSYNMLADGCGFKGTTTADQWYIALPQNKGLGIFDAIQINYANTNTKVGECTFNNIQYNIYLVGSGIRVNSYTIRKTS